MLLVKVVTGALIIANWFYYTVKNSWDSKYRFIGGLNIVQHELCRWLLTRQDTKTYILIPISQTFVLISAIDKPTLVWIMAIIP